MALRVHLASQPKSPTEAICRKHINTRTKEVTQERFLANTKNNHAHKHRTQVLVLMEAPTPNFSSPQQEKDLQIVQVMYAQGHNAQQTHAPSHTPHRYLYTWFASDIPAC